MPGWHLAMRKACRQKLGERQHSLSCIPGGNSWVASQVLLKSDGVLAAQSHVHLYGLVADIALGTSHHLVVSKMCHDLGLGKSNQVCSVVPTRRHEDCDAQSSFVHGLKHTGI